MTRTIQSVSLISLYESEKDLTIVKHKANKERKSAHIALLLKLSIIPIACVLLAIMVLSIFTIHSMRTTSLKPAISVGDMTAIEEAINANIDKYIKRMTTVTIIILLAYAILLGLGYKFLSHRVK